MIIVVSDTHGDLRAWETIREGYFDKARLILHAGDVLYHGPRNPLTSGYAPGDLGKQIRDLSVPILIAQGNCDAQVDTMVMEIPFAGEYVVTFVDGVKVLMHHGHQLSWEQVESLCLRWSIDLCIQGHTHVPSLVRKGTTVYLNPGSPSLPKGDNPKGTFALWEGNRIQLVELTTGQVMNELYLKDKQKDPS